MAPLPPLHYKFIKQIYNDSDMNSRDYLESEQDEFQNSSNIHPGKYEDDSSNESEQEKSNSEDQEEQSNDDEESESQSNLNQEELLEMEILKEAISKEKKRNPFQEEVMAEILDKLRDNQNASRDKTGEDLVTLRIQEVVYNKLLVMSYGSSEFRLVRAYYRLGAAYLHHDCIDQAIEHLTAAIYKNQKLFDDLSRTPLFQCSMQNLLGQCLMKKQQYDDAIQILQRSIEVASEMQSSKSEGIFAEENCNKARTLLAQCYCKHKEFDQAISIINEVLATTKKMNRGKDDYAFALVEKAKILSMKDDHAQAVNAQEEAINLLIQSNYPKPEEVAEMYEKLGEYFEKMGNPESSLECVQKVKTLYQQIYSGEDKRVIKARRKIATSLLKNERFKEAVNELLEIVELEEKVFGETSMQIARTLKLLGTVYISLEMGDAKTHLRKALNIFHSHGNKKQVQQIREKLKLLMSGNANQQDLKMLSEQDL